METSVRGVLELTALCCWYMYQGGGVHGRRRLSIIKHWTAVAFFFFARLSSRVDFPMSDSRVMQGGCAKGMHLSLCVCLLPGVCTVACQCTHAPYARICVRRPADACSTWGVLEYTVASTISLLHVLICARAGRVSTRLEGETAQHNTFGVTAFTVVSTWAERVEREAER